MILRELIERLEEVRRLNGMHGSEPVFLCVEGETVPLRVVDVEELMVRSPRTWETVPRDCVILSPSSPPCELSGMEGPRER